MVEKDASSLLHALLYCSFGLPVHVIHNMGAGSMGAWLLLAPILVYASRRPNKSKREAAP